MSLSVPFAVPTTSSHFRRVLIQAIPFVAGVLMCLLCVRLGFWQLQRAEFKAERQAHLDAIGMPVGVASAAALQEWQRVTVKGNWLAEQTVFLDNRVHHAQPGYHVLTPFVVSGSGDIVIVNRGWIAAGLRRDVLPAVTTPVGTVQLSGLLLRPDLKSYRLDDGKEAGRVWQRADPKHFAARLGKEVASLILFQENDSGDGLLRDWPRPDLGVGMHKAYAVQWFAFALTALGLTAYFAWRRFKAPRNGKMS